MLCFQFEEHNEVEHSIEKMSLGDQYTYHTMRSCSTGTRTVRHQEEICAGVGDRRHAGTAQPGVGGAAARFPMPSSQRGGYGRRLCKLPKDIGVENRNSQGP